MIGDFLRWKGEKMEYNSAQKFLPLGERLPDSDKKWDYLPFDIPLLHKLWKV
jgi:hypothetical protein